MLYRGYEVYVEKMAGGADTVGGGVDPVCGCGDSGGSCVIVEGVRDFDPVHIFECGQCFRWKRQSDGSYTGVVRSRVANVVYKPCTPGESDNLGTLVLKNVTMEDFRQVWFDYFDLGTDYALIKKAVSIDPIMESAVNFGCGIRLLRQEPWEVLISFILSSNNRIPRIMKIIDDICRLFGTQIEYDGRKYFSFPDAAALSACSLEQIQECRAGYRCSYIHETAGAAAKGQFDPARLTAMETAEARKTLLQLKGVGNKVADCILLYSGIKRDVFPTDVWVRRVMEELYFKREASFSEIWRFAEENFDGYAGAAQQYLFYFAREQKIGS